MHPSTLIEINAAMGHAESVQCYLRALVEGEPVEAQYWMLQAKRSMALLNKKMEVIFSEEL